MLQKLFSLSCLLLSLIFSLLSHLSTSVVDSFVYGGCSQLRFLPRTPYESNVNSALTSLVSSAFFSNFNNFTISLPGSTQGEVVYSLFQCRDDLSSSSCRECVAHSVSRLEAICPESIGGAIQLEGCFVKYDNVSFWGVEDKTEVLKRCGPSVGYNSDVLTGRDVILGYLTAGNGQYFRVGGSKSVQGVAQCVHDLSLIECQNCLLEASGQLRSKCGTSAWGDLFFEKCYVRYSDRGSHSRNNAGNDNHDDDMDRTLAIVIGIIAVVAVIIVFLSYLSKLCDKKGGK